MILYEYLFEYNNVFLEPEARATKYATFDLTIILCWSAYH